MWLTWNGSLLPCNHFQLLQICVRRDPNNCSLVLVRSAPVTTITKQYGGRGGCGRQPAGRARSTGVAYIKVHESEIADDYPEPAQYAAEEEEADELVLFGEEEDYGAAAPDPDWLPRKTLNDFSVYNSEVRWVPIPHNCRADEVPDQAAPGSIRFGMLVYQQPGS